MPMEMGNTRGCRRYEGSENIVASALPMQTGDNVIVNRDSQAAQRKHYGRLFADSQR